MSWLPALSVLPARIEPRRVALTLGCQRSGTTLLHLVLDRHPQVASLDEPDSYQFLASGRARHARAGRAARINAKIPKMGAEPSGRRIRALLDAGAFGVYLYRDPRAVAASMMRLELPEGRWAAIYPRREAAPLSRACGVALPPGYRGWSAWRFCLNHIALKHRFYLGYLAGPSTLPVCYERLVAQPEPWLRRVAAHLGLPFDAAMMAHHLDSRGEAAGGTRRDRAIDTASLDAWRAQLSPEQVLQVERACSEALAFWAAGEAAATVGVAPGMVS